MKKISLTFFFLLLTTSCSGEDSQSSSQNVELANPASVYCIQQGGKLDIRTDTDGGQYGMCVFPDGTEVEEWEYFRANQN